MSATAIHESKQPRHLCQRCRDRKAKFQYRGVVRADRDHTLCFECYRAERNRGRVRALAVQQRRLGVLTPAEISHRRTMLTYLASSVGGSAPRIQNHGPSVALDRPMRA